MGIYSRSELEEILNKYGDMVYRMAYAQVKNRDTVDDIYQEVCMKLIKQKSSIEPEEHLKAWLLRTTINCCKDYWKSAWFQKISWTEEKKEEPVLDKQQNEGYITEEAFDDVSVYYISINKLFKICYLKEKQMRRGYMGSTYAEDSIFIGVVIGVMISYLVVIGVAIANYIMSSLAIYKLASRRKISNPWMAWLPFANDWIVGKITDDYDERNGMKRKWRVVLLVLSLISVIGLVVTYVSMIVWMFNITAQYEHSEPPVDEIFGGMIFVYVVLIVVALVATAYTFCKAICIYKIFESTVPKKSVKYMLLYLMVPLAGAICLLKCKNKGYPEEIMQDAECLVMVQEEEE